MPRKAMHAIYDEGGLNMRYHLIGVNEDTREISMVADDDENCIVVINAAEEAWSGKDTDIEVLNAPNGATVYYLADDGSRTYKNYRFEDGKATIV